MYINVIRGFRRRPESQAQTPPLRRRIGGLCVSLTLIALGCIGCGESSEAGTSNRGSMAYVVGAHANSPASAHPGTELDTAVVDQRRLTIVAVDGKPWIVKSVDLRSRASNEDARSREISQFKTELGNALSEIRPVTAEVDLLAAIDLGARSLDRDPKTMIIEDSGLSTAGLLRFQQPGMLQASARDVADRLERARELPNLSGVTVILRGFGDVASPQEPLGTAKRNNLIDIWSAILTRAGARVQSDRAPRRGEAWPDTAPQVTTVAIERPTPSIDPVPIPASEFFEENSPVLLDRERAIETLRPFAEYATATPGRIDLIGTTARDGDRDGQLRLSRQRAEAIKALLVDPLGVPASRITTDGVGSFGPWYIPDRAEDGSLLPAEAARNRTVRIQFQKV
ncbi:OmpA family protein [Nocardia brasiliensis]